MDTIDLIRLALVAHECTIHSYCTICPFYKNNNCILVRIKDASNDEELLKILHETIDK